MRLFVSCGKPPGPDTEDNDPVGAAVAEFTAGLFHACALRTGGDTFCWGLNDGWQLGIAEGALGPVEVAGQRG